MFNMDQITILSNNEMSEELCSYYKDLLNVKSLYDKGATGKNLICAVIDSGCDINHPVFKNRIIGGINFTSEGCCTDYSDTNGHGTHVAGLICSNKLNMFQGGIALDAKLLICKALGANGSGSLDSLIHSINYAIDNNADVINMSLGGTVNSPELYQAVKRADQKGITICCASGNNGMGDNGTIDEFCYPGSYQEVIEVGAINKNNIPSYFSNSNTMIDCISYGERIFSAFPGNRFALLDGTSQATPLVSGSLLLIKEWFINEFGRRPSNEELYAALIKCTVSLDSYSKKQVGFGYIDLSKL